MWFFENNNNRMPEQKRKEVIQPTGIKAEQTAPVQMAMPEIQRAEMPVQTPSAERSADMWPTDPVNLAIEKDFEDVK